MHFREFYASRLDPLRQEIQRIEDLSKISTDHDAVSAKERERETFFIYFSIHFDKMEMKQRENETEPEK